MPVSLLALCKPQAAIIVKRIKVSRDVQNQLEGVFIEQERAFFAGVDEEIEFDGGWQPEPSQLLYAPITAEAQAAFQTAQGNLVALPEINVDAFGEEGIRALAVVMERDGVKRLLLQEFSSRQLLERRFSLVLDGDTFNRLTKPTFTLNTTLAGIIENDRIKFQKFARIKLIFDLMNLYQEATDAELDSFCAQDQIQISDADAFKKIADQQMRKLVRAITERGTLEQYTPAQISEAAAGENFAVEMAENRIVMPTVKANAKALLHFLDEGLYRSALSGDLFITNSKRRHVPAQ